MIYIFPIYTLLLSILAIIFYIESFYINDIRYRLNEIKYRKNAINLTAILMLIWVVTNLLALPSYTEVIKIDKLKEENIYLKVELADIKEKGMKI